ncbi:sulfite exporter TauE/SafE family protein [Ferrovibrio sp.]|uniref:sulfite exporter TauE/SafE family protein n=1 Tax=Ferrovibrio sp. TaxID=1917215 RepID=UPI0025BD00E2|nr:sulfite exporter TauE/SafE family protein [Ferrovibrio sp.]MBX3454429.1 sulfite exporter TauE/SafE family protein [Ferrovibrio sp.]
MFADWSSFLNACRSLMAGEIGLALPQLGLPASLFLLGLVGGFSHCAGMCGPFVLSQTGRRLAAQPLDGSASGLLLTRLTGIALLPYHLGRGSIYTVLGAAAGGLLGGTGLLLGHGALPGYALLLMAALFLLQAFVQLAPRLGLGFVLNWHFDIGAGFAERITRPLAPLFNNPTGLGGFVLGLGLGFLPCGLLYTALLAAGASGSALSGALAMAAFTLGTLPALLIVAALGSYAGRRFGAAMRWWLPVVLVINALAAGAMALRWLGKL